MPRYGLEVKLNNQVLSRAGFEKDYNVLSCIVDSLMRNENEEASINLRVGGLNISSKQHVEWYHDKLQEGDEIRIKIITENFDKPTQIRPQDSQGFVLEKKIEYFHKLKAELKDYL